MDDELLDDDLRRAYDLVALGDMGGARTEPSRFGRAVFDDDLPLRYDSNYLLVDRPPGEVPAEDLAAELIQEARRLARPAILVRDGRAGERLAAPMERAGWAVHRGLVMASRRRPERSAPGGVVREVGEAALRPARRRQVAGEPWATPEVVEQLLDAKVAIARAVEARFFAVLAAGDGGDGGDGGEDGEVVSYVDLYVDREGRSAQIEHLATIDGHGGRGYASALVLHALAEARRARCDLVFLLADADDWPKLLYRRLGFDEIGRYIKFIRPDEDAGG